MGVPAVGRVRGSEVTLVSAAAERVRRRHLLLHVDCWASVLVLVRGGLIQGFLKVRVLRNRR